MFSIEDEKRVIYELMRQLIIERRELSKHYYELKQQLDDLGDSNDLLVNKENKPISVLEKEKIRDRDYFHRNNKISHHISFDRMSKNILSILKESPVPLSNKQIAEKLTTEYELNVSYSNLTSNILPKMLKERSLSIEKAYRGYWQYRLTKL
ncbi:hypothetical protein K9D10_001723 [Enterococcus faecalis]|nr:hypothetical protein [Enterococcus faecalis]